jgi:hypothetical protein
MKFAFNSQDAVQHLREAMEQNVELTEVFDKASRDVSNAFTNAGDVVSGTIGTACANCWGDGSSDYFKKKLLIETEKFLIDKVERIIRLANMFHDQTQNIYDSGAKSETK